MKIFENEDFAISEEDTVTFKFKKSAFDKSFAEFLKKHDELASSAIKVGSDALASYKTAKNVTTRFFAKTYMEKKIFKDIVDTLNSSGKFRLVSKRVKDGGIFYELVRK